MFFQSFEASLEGICSFSLHSVVLQQNKRYNNIGIAQNQTKTIPPRQVRGRQSTKKPPPEKEAEAYGPAVTDAITMLSDRVHNLYMSRVAPGMITRSRRWGPRGYVFIPVPDKPERKKAEASLPQS
jgi:hypothetical protein